MDHLIPVSKGGGDDAHNLVLACSSCNSRKGTKTLEEYRKYREDKDSPIPALWEAHDRLESYAGDDLSRQADAILEVIHLLEGRLPPLRFWGEIDE
jgi:hypothetical protein